METLCKMLRSSDCALTAYKYQCIQVVQSGPVQRFSFNATASVSVQWSSLRQVTADSAMVCLRLTMVSRRFE